ncbi:MAG: sporulation initiation factor Spo0A C-terminal domain-containing protein [Clostridiales bacterium]|nr:sporulation initiation factor Spo0A C-terminal domain-containing protein [Clostridiales bacterium]
MSINEIIEKVAEMNNTTAEEVYAEMQMAINAGFHNPDPQVQKEWEKVSYRGNSPTPEDVILYAMEQFSSEEETEACVLMV